MQKHHEFLRNVNGIQDGALEQSRKDAAGNLSSMPVHLADLGTDNYEQEFALGLMDSGRRLLNEIDATLERIEEGRYAIREGTQIQIPKLRFDAQPWARYCVEHARKLEQGRPGSVQLSISENKRLRQT